MSLLCGGESMRWRPIGSYSPRHLQVDNDNVASHASAFSSPQCQLSQMFNLYPYSPAYVPHSTTKHGVILTPREAASKSRPAAKVRNGNSRVHNVGTTGMTPQ
jgi:hypothetical protein